MKRILSLSTLLAVAALLVGCETTGDPTQGGLFGWSESKYRAREAEKVHTLRTIEADTASQKKRANSLSGSVEEERSKLH